VATAWKLHALVSATPSLTLTQLASGRVSSGIQKFVGRSAGDVYPLFQGITDATPEFSFETQELVRLINACGITGTSLAQTDWYFKKCTDLGTVVAAGTSAHERHRMTQGFLWWDRISAEHNGIATASCRAVATWDGSNNPLVRTGSTALSGTVAADQFFSCGPVFLNSAQVAGVMGVDVELNATVKILSADGEPWPTMICLYEINPVVTIRTLSADSWSLAGVAGVPLSAMSVYLRKYANDGDRVADATEAHLKFTASAGLITVDESAGNLNDEASTTLTVALRSASAGSAPLTVAVAAITT